MLRTKGIVVRGKQPVKEERNEVESQEKEPDISADEYNKLKEHALGLVEYNDALKNHIEYLNSVNKNLISKMELVKEENAVMKSAVEKDVLEIEKKLEDLEKQQAGATELKKKITTVKKVQVKKPTSSSKLTSPIPTKSTESKAKSTTIKKAVAKK